MDGNCTSISLVIFLLLFVQLQFTLDIHSDLDKVRLFGCIFCYFSKNYFSGCFLAHWELKFWLAKEVVSSIQVSEFLFWFQLSSVSSTDAIFSTAEYFSAISCLFFWDYPLLNFNCENSSLFNFCFFFLTEKFSEKVR